jgi:LPXTG-motif cell wall-anchored protein
MHFDLTMTNVYGNSVSIKVPAPPGKTVETTAATLPNTGPGSSLLIGGIVVMLAGYFYARSRLLATESNIVLHETTIGGML